MLAYNETKGMLVQQAQALVAAWNAHDTERIVSLYAPDFEGSDVGEATPQRGRAAVRAAAERYLAAFPDLRLVDVDAIADDERVALAWTAEGTHRGPVLNCPATGRPVRVRGIVLLTFQGSLVRQADLVWDVAGLLRTIGLLPEL